MSEYKNPEVPPIETLPLQELPQDPSKFTEQTGKPVVGSLGIGAKKGRKGLDEILAVID
jgi:hypothetical protein